MRTYANTANESFVDSHEIRSFALRALAYEDIFIGNMGSCGSCIGCGSNRFYNTVFFVQPF